MPPRLEERRVCPHVDFGQKYPAHFLQVKHAKWQQVAIESLYGLLDGVSINSQPQQERPFNRLPNLQHDTHRLHIFVLLTFSSLT